MTTIHVEPTRSPAGASARSAALGETQMSYARRGVTTPEMAYVAAREQHGEKEDAEPLRRHR